MSYRTPAVAGLFYPANPVVLEDEISTLLSVTALSEKYTNIFGLVAPHAGYIYSGKTAAYAYNQLADKRVDNIIIISPSHREYFKGCCIYDEDGYSTPLGNIDINKEMREEIISGSAFIFSGREGHRKEHAIEVHLPFLQVLLEKFNIVPLVMGDQEKMYVDDLAKSIANAADDNTIVLASSDLSHFYTREAASSLDNTASENIKSMDYIRLIKDLELKKCEACGGGVIAALLKAAELKKFSRSAILHRSDSGDVSGDLNEVVGYLSAVVYN